MCSVLWRTPKGEVLPTMDHPKDTVATCALLNSRDDAENVARAALRAFGMPAKEVKQFFSYLNYAPKG